MNIFLDTSSLFKLYHTEGDTKFIENIFSDNKIQIVYLSELAKIEFTSTVWKKVCNKEIGELKAKEIIGHYEIDLGKYTFSPIESIIIEQARKLITKYGINGLRTLDSLQLATAIYLKNEVDLFITSDKLLSEFFKQESLPIDKPIL